jgi:arsenite transporter
MSVQCEVTAKQAAGVSMSVFECWLTLWVALCILVGIGLGQFLPAPFQFLGRLEVAQVNIPVGLLIWVMMIPMLVKIDFGALHQVRDQMITLMNVGCSELTSGVFLRAHVRPMSSTSD